VRRSRNGCVERYVAPRGSRHLRGESRGRFLAERPTMKRHAIREYMSASAHTIGDEQPLALAKRMMREHVIRHLPVLRGGKLVGVVSERDVAFIKAMSTLDDASTPVSEAMSSDVYAVGPEADLASVAADMAEHKLGCAVVVVGKEVVGVFTTVDGMRALADMLSERSAERSAVSFR
jgi:acetoin utilization protein AcuB